MISSDLQTLGFLTMETNFCSWSLSIPHPDSHQFSTTLISCLMLKLAIDGTKFIAVQQELLCHGPDLILQTLLCLSMSLLAEQPGMLHSSSDNSLNDPALNLVCLEPWTLCSSHELPIKAMPLHFLFASLLCSIQPITPSCRYCCHLYLCYHSLMTLGLFLDYASAWSQPVIICYWPLAYLLTMLLLTPTCYICYWTLKPGDPEARELVLSRNKTHLYHQEFWWTPVST